MSKSESGLLEIAHQKQIQKIMIELCNVREELYRVRGEQAETRRRLLVYESATTVPSEAKTEPYPEPRRER